MKYAVKEIASKLAKEMVKKYHYSGKIIHNSLINLGVFKDDELVGCLQYGYPLNHKKTSDKIHKDYKMMELNRMVMIDSEPRNSESQAIAVCHKWLRENTDLDYILSFSDGKEGNVGYIYQATNWTYIGYLLSDSFFELDGNILHSITAWHRYKEKHPLKETHTTKEILCKTFNNVKRITSKQYIYLFPLKKRVKFPFEAKPYPKKDKEIKIISECVYKDENGVYLPKGKTTKFSEENLKSVW